MPAHLPAVRITDLVHSGSIRAKFVRDQNLGITVPLHGFFHEFQCRSLIPGLRDIGFKYLTLMVDGTPQIVRLPTDLHEDFVQMPLPLRRLSHSFRLMFSDLVREVNTEAIYPMPDRFVADVDPAFMQQVLDISQ